LLQIVIRQGHGVAVAVAAIVRARSVLTCLYGRDCTVFSIWKRSPANDQSVTAAAAADEDNDDVFDDAVQANLVGGSEYPQQQQQQPIEEDNDGLNDDNNRLLLDEAEQQQQQQQQHYWVPRQLYKLLVIACDPDDSMTAGWVPRNPWQRQQQWQQRQQQQQQSPQVAAEGVDSG
jgi:hypothetical protein